MKEQNQSTLKWWIKAYLSFAGLGFAPKAPGTVGTLGAVVFIYLLSQLELPQVVHIFLFISILFFTIFVTENVQKKYHLHDPQWIVIDEVLGFWMAWMIQPQMDTLNLVFLFGWFRFFDIVKIWPANLLDRWTHGAGTILDDVVSGVYAGICTFLTWQILLRLAIFS